MHRTRKLTVQGTNGRAELHNGLDSECGKLWCCRVRPHDFLAKQTELPIRAPVAREGLDHVRSVEQSVTLRIRVPGERGIADASSTAFAKYKELTTPKKISLRHVSPDLSEGFRFFRPASAQQYAGRVKNVERVFALSQPRYTRGLLAFPRHNR